MSHRAQDFSTFLLQNARPTGSSHTTSRTVSRTIPDGNNSLGGNNSNRIIDSCTVSIPIADLEIWLSEYFIDCEGRDQTASTLQGKREVFQKLLWFLRAKAHAECGLPQLRRFFVYLRNGHLEPGGRWGNRQQTKPLGRRSVEYYYIYLQTAFRWFVSEGLIAESPLARIARPEKSTPNITTFSDADLVALLNAAARSPFAERNVALMMFLLDTGLRVTELCKLTMSAVDLYGLRAEIMGKGRKQRMVHFSRETAKIVRAYLRKHPRQPEQSLFCSLGGNTPGRGLTRSGVLQLFKELGVAAGLQGVRCSPHTMRHAFATNLARSGAPSATVQDLLGHSTLHMTMLYTHLAEADVANHHRRHSPVTRLLNNLKGK
jgi:integrase/recombinase XerC